LAHSSTRPHVSAQLRTRAFRRDRRLRTRFAQRHEKRISRHVDPAHAHSSSCKGETKMRFMVMHKVDASMEAGERPSQDIIKNMGAFIGEKMKAGVFIDGAG